MKIAIVNKATSTIVLMSKCPKAVTLFWVEIFFNVVLSIILSKYILNNLKSAQTSGYMKNIICV